jgi:hypothetical protein
MAATVGTFPEPAAKPLERARLIMLSTSILAQNAWETIWGQLHPHPYWAYEARRPHEEALCRLKVSAHVSKARGVHR